MKIIMSIIGIAMIVAAIRIRYWYGSRHSNRRNAFGIEGFSSYKDSLKKQYFERLMLLAYMLFISGFIIIMVQIFSHALAQQIL